MEKIKFKYYYYSEDYTSITHHRQSIILNSLSIYLTIRTKHFHYSELSTVQGFHIDFKICLDEVKIYYFCNFSPDLLKLNSFLFM